MIGLAGAHRTGKTTLAKAYSEKHETPLCLTSTSGVFAELGYSPQVVYPFDIKMDIQEAILERLTMQYDDIGERVFVSDRTPIDMLAYTLSEINRESLSEAQEMRLERYLKDCFAACNKYFTVIVVVQPGIKLVADAGKAPIGMGFIEHMTNLVMGLTVNERVAAAHAYIPTRIVDLDERVQCVRNTVIRILERAMVNYGDTIDESGHARLH